MNGILTETAIISMVIILYRRVWWNIYLILGRLW